LLVLPATCAGWYVLIDHYWCSFYSNVSVLVLNFSLTHFNLSYNSILTKISYDTCYWVVYCILWYLRGGYSQVGKYEWKGRRF
jgi:hypothetical protein